MTLRRYERYKDSGVECLGAVPAHWEVQPIKRLLLSVEQGWSPQCEKFPAESGQWGVLKVGCVNGGRFNADENKALPVDLEPLPELGIRRGDVLVSRANTRELVGSVAVADRDYAQLLLCDKLYRLRVIPERCEPSFLAHFIGSVAARSVIEAAATGASSSMLNIAQGAIVGMSMALPPVDEQRALLRFLDAETAKIDTLVAEQQWLIELLTEKRQAIIAHAVTKGLNLVAPMKDSSVEWLGRVPSHWSVMRLGSVFEQVDERGDNSLPVLSVSIHDGVSDSELDDAELDRKVTRSDDRTKYKRVVAGDLVYNMMRAWQGGFGTVAVDGMVSPAYVVARPRGVLPTAFIERVLRTPNAVEEMRRHSRGVADFRLRLYWDEFKNIVVALPPRAEAEAIDKHVTDIEAKIVEVISAAENCIRMLRERRTALISATVTGQIDVRNSAPVESALAETRADIAAGRYVVESAAAHVARVQAMAAADEHPSSPPHSC